MWCLLQSFECLDFTRVVVCAWRFSRTGSGVCAAGLVFRSTFGLGAMQISLVKMSDIAKAKLSS